MKTDKHRTSLKESDLKVTPQRVAVLEALNTLRDHPTAEKIKEYVVKKIQI
jgi:Fur family transcriptional regulator, peroxide stress response regulator